LTLNCVAIEPEPLQYKIIGFNLKRLCGVSGLRL
jgi:hypothetical protein